MTDQTSHPAIGGLVARRLSHKGDRLAEFAVPHGPTHRVESIIADRTITQCGKELRETVRSGLGLVYWPQGARHLPTCRGGCR